jgi:hypothetical protein
MKNFILASMIMFLSVNVTARDNHYLKLEFQLKKDTASLVQPSEILNGETFRFETVAGESGLIRCEDFMWKHYMTVLINFDYPNKFLRRTLKPSLQDCQQELSKVLIELKGTGSDILTVRYYSSGESVLSVLK